MDKVQDRIRGSLIGGAIGDALGYPVEFVDSFGEIQSLYGERGMTRLEVRWTDTDAASIGKAVVSDDTQMTLFTANGLLNAAKEGIAFKQGIREAYIEWYLTQIGRKPGKHSACWIGKVPELNHRRSPGTTCIYSLNVIYSGKEPVNNSKGCGGVMRVAPVALYAAAGGRMSVTEASLLAGDAARITHQAPLGFIPAALASHIIYRLARDEGPSKLALEGYIREGMKAMEELYPQYPDDVSCMGGLCEKAITLARNFRPDFKNIESIGEGWTGEEALSIAIYCCLRHFGKFEDAVIASVNHGGDSDSTGSVTGNILGAALGYDSIPRFYKDDLEMHDLILHMADDLYRGEVTKI